MGLIQRTGSIDYSTFGGSRTFGVSAGFNDAGVLDLAKGDWDMPVPWTITLGLPQSSRFFPSSGYPLNPPFGVYFDHGHLFAIVEWGFAGTTFEAEVDWRQGCAFGVTAQWVRVRAVLPNDQAVPAGPGGEGLTVQAAALPNAPCANPSAYRTVFYGDLAAADVQNRYIPAYAHEAIVRHNAGNPSTSTYELEWGEGGPAPVTVAQDVMAVSANRNILDYGDWNPVPFDANWAGIRNTSASTQADMRIIYRLGLG